MLTPAQCRAARGILRWTQDELAQASQVGLATIRLFESEQSSPRRATLSAMKRALQEAGVEFIEGDGKPPGVRPASP